MFKIGDIEIKNPYILAPMSSVCDIAYRIICRKNGAGLAFSGMISANAYVRKNKKTINKIISAKEEKPVALQIFGNNIENMVKTAKYISEIADIIDINAGCPVKKVYSSGSGAALIEKPDILYKMIKTIVRRVDVAVTVKIRKTPIDYHKNTVQIAQVIEDAGASAITIHGRTRSQFYSGRADWDIIKQIKEAVSIPVLGNGDITDYNSAQKMIKYTGCQGVMIGRAAIGNPEIFMHLNSCGKYFIPSYPDQVIRMKNYLEYIKLAKKYKIPFSAIKAQGVRFTKNLYKGKTIRQRILQMDSLGKLEDYISEIINRENL